ncbi:MAG: dihydrofolate reductase family protein [Acidobacteriota bacterium]|nr:dihydrofolate reductase family protein [Acidobacteriota bacterium]
MKTISVFNHVTLDGFYAGPDGEIDWFKSIKKDPALDKYLHGQSQGGSSLMMGRTTYAMMKSYWPTPEAIKSDPEMARVMDHGRKVVFSKTLKKVEEGPNWKNITLVHDIDRKQILKLKEKDDFTILGSGSIVQQLANLGLIDAYQLVVVPIVLGAGKPLFKDVRATNLKLVEEKSFKNGLVVLKYKPKAN